MAPEHHDDHDHPDHGHAHRHPVQPLDEDIPCEEFEFMEIALRELLVEKGVIAPGEIVAKIEEWEQRSPVDGARVVARAWADPAFKARLIADANAAIGELGLEHTNAKLVVLEDTAVKHHLVTCTLCSCYPRQLLGFPPAWYKSREYRARSVRDPRGVLAEFGVSLPDHVAVEVADATADCRYLVLPLRPAGSEAMSEAELVSLVTRDCMIGVALPRRAG